MFSTNTPAENSDPSLSHLPSEVALELVYLQPSPYTAEPGPPGKFWNPQQDLF